MSDTQPRVLAALVCDDVRREDNGKEILIGIYPGSILVPKFPATMVLSFWLYLQPHQAGELHLEFRVTGAEQGFAYMDGVVEFGDSDEPGSLTFPKIPLRLGTECLLEFQWRLAGGEWEVLAKKHVRIAAAQNPKAAS
jgi:hypothetical protein